MIALSIGSLLCVGIFNLFNTMQNLHQRQMIISHEQEDSRFISLFLTEKIQMAGNWSCIAKLKKQPRSIVIRRFTKNQADSKLNIDIKSGTELLQMHECVRFQDKKQYLPIAFYIASTFRVSSMGKHIDALFYQIDNHPREELVTGMTNFRITLYRVLHQKRNIRAVRIDFLLTSIDDVLKNKQSYWFERKWRNPNDFALYQPGILYAVRRMEM